MADVTLATKEVANQLETQVMKEIIRFELLNPAQRTLSQRFGERTELIIERPAFA